MKTMIEMAKKAGWEYANDDQGFEPLWAFAELVRADERAACAKVCEQGEFMTFGCVAAAIRARNNT